LRHCEKAKLPESNSGQGFLRYLEKAREKKPVARNDQGERLNASVMLSGS
jgi:hypothetical protein